MYVALAGISPQRGDHPEDFAGQKIESNSYGTLKAA
jgi:hypothetical protein